MTFSFSQSLPCSLRDDVYGTGLSQMTLKYFLVSTLLPDIGQSLSRRASLATSISVLWCPLTEITSTSLPTRDIIFNFYGGFHPAQATHFVFRSLERKCIVSTFLGFSRSHTGSDHVQISHVKQSFWIPKNINR